MDPAVDRVRLERLEIDYWRHSAASTGDRHSVDALTNILNKVGDAGTYLVSLLPHLDHFRRASTILEVGAGQGWAGCLVKRLCPDTRVAVSDISPWALAGLATWEHVFDVRVDAAFAARSDALPVEDGSVDCVFAFQAAHHFLDHEAVLAEMARVLALRGHAFYFHEPACPAAWYPLAVRRVNRKRPEVREDVLVPSRVRALAARVGLTCHVKYTPTLYKRAPVETVYYGVLHALPVLQRIMPCTATYVLGKEQEGRERT